MDNPELGEKEYRLINEVSRNSTITQREISQRLGFSLGMTNILLKRLTRKGYIKITQLNRRKVQYLLTPAGIGQGMKRSYRYLSHTFRTLREIKSKIQSILLAEYEKGRRKFIILGDGELADITEIALRNLGKKDITYSKLPLTPPSPSRGEDKGEGKKGNSYAIKLRHLRCKPVGVGFIRPDSLFLLTNPKQKIKNNKVLSLNLLKEIANFPEKIETGKL